jgi:hypothetical protein
LGSIWPGTAAEWQCPAVDAVCEGLVASGAIGPDPHAASRSLGEQRADLGTYLAEARADLEVALILARVGRQLRLELLDALTIGWADRSVDRLSAVELVDGVNQMATLSYLAMRLGELYREAELAGVDVSEEYVLANGSSARRGCAPCTRRCSTPSSAASRWWPSARNGCSRCPRVPSRATPTRSGGCAAS